MEELLTSPPWGPLSPLPGGLSPVATELSLSGSLAGFFLHTGRHHASAWGPRAQCGLDDSGSLRLTIWLDWKLPLPSLQVQEQSAHRSPSKVSGTDVWKGKSLGKSTWTLDMQGFPGKSKVFRFMWLLPVLGMPLVSRAAAAGWRQLDQGTQLCPPHQG